VTLYSIYSISNCCLSLYLNIAGLCQSPGKHSRVSWKSYEFFESYRVGCIESLKGVKWDENSSESFSAEVAQ